MLFHPIVVSKIYKKILAGLGFQRVIPDIITREHFFDLYFSIKDNPFVVQLGANDGKTHDPLHKYVSQKKIAGLLVEPQPDIFERLKENYSENPNLKFANVAVSDREGAIPFYRINPELVMEGKEYKASSGSSFYREQIIGNVRNRLPPISHNILKVVSSDPESYVIEESVRVVTPSRLFSEQEVEKIDFMLIDCQGHDYAILKGIDFRQFSPDIINYEHSLLSEEDKVASRKLLQSHGYRYFIHEGDTCAYKSIQVS